MHLAWTLDWRPVWDAAGTYLLGADYDAAARAAHEAALVASLTDTGKVKAPRVVFADRLVTVRLRLKADTEPMALAHAAVIIDVAAADAGTGLLGELAGLAVRAAATPRTSPL